MTDYEVGETAKQERLGWRGALAAGCFSLLLCIGLNSGCAWSGRELGEASDATQAILAELPPETKAELAAAGVPMDAIFAAIESYLSTRTAPPEEPLGPEEWAIIAAMSLVGGQTRRTSIEAALKLAKLIFSPKRA